MSFEKWDTFREVANTRSLSKAGEHTRQSVSGVSYAIKKVEEELGVPLLLYTKDGMCLTSEGKKLMPYIERMLECKDQLLLQASKLQRAESGVVRVGGLMNPVARFMPKIILSINEAYPNIEVQLVLHPYEQIQADLNNGAIDVALAGNPQKCKNLDFVLLLEDRYCVVFPAIHPLYGKNEVSLEDLRGERLILPEWGLYDAEFRSTLLNSGIGEQICYTLPDERASVQMARSGLGVAILTEMTLPEADSGCVSILSSWTPRPFGVVTRKQDRCSRVAQFFATFVQKWFQENRRAAVSCAQ